MDPVWGGLAQLMGGAARPDGQGAWTLPPGRRWHKPSPLQPDPSRTAGARRRVPTAAEQAEGKQLARDVAREVHRALLALEQESSRRQRRLQRRVAPSLVERARVLYDQGLSMRRVAAKLVDESPFATAGGLRNWLTAEFAAHGWERRGRVDATRLALTTHGAYASRDRDAINARRREVRGSVLCAGERRQGNARPRPCQKHAMPGSDYCYAHDPAYAWERAQQTAEMRSLRGRAGNNQQEDHRESRDHIEGQHGQRPRTAVARPRSGAEEASAVGR